MQPIKVEDQNFQANRNAHVSADWRVRGPRRGRRAGGRGRRWLLRGAALLSLALVLIGGLAVALGKSQNISSFAEYGLKLADSLAEKAGFGVVQISLKGHRYASDADIFAALGQTDRRSIFGFDVGKATRSLDRLAWVERAHVMRRFPDEILVDIEENKPFAVWRLAGKFWLIDRNGQKLAPLTSSDFAHLPLVTGAGGNLKIAAFEKMLNGFSRIKAALSSVSYIAGRRWTLNFKSGTMVHLPAEYARRALQKLSRLMNEHNNLSTGFASIDLRLNDRVTLKNKTVQSAKAAPHSSEGSALRASVRANVLTPGDRAILAPYQGRAPLSPSSSQQTASGG